MHNITSSLRSLLALLLVISLAACSTTKSSTADTIKPSTKKDAPLEKSLLWEISGKNISQPSYLFGTIHIIDADRYFLPKGTLEAIDNTDIMVFEIDLADMEDMDQIMGLLMSAMMEGNVTIKDLVSEEDYAMISKHFSDMGLPFMMLERIKPMFLSMMGGDIDMGSLQSGEMTSYELKFGEMAKSKGMETAGLETMEFQMSLFDSIPYDDQAVMLVESIKSGGGESDLMEKMMDTYTTQDVDALAEFITSESGDVAGFEDNLITKRNHAWIPQIKKLSGDRPAFYAVGAGHLGGKEGVIRLLRQEGYTVQAINK